MKTVTVRISSTIAREFIELGVEGWPDHEGMHEMSIDKAKKIELYAASMVEATYKKPAVRMAYRGLMDQIGRIMELADKPDAAAEVSHAKPSEVVELTRADILCPGQVRTEFDDESIAELAEDIKVNGLINPILVRVSPLNHSQARYLLVAGERRLRACELAGVPVLARVVDADAKMARRLQLSENIHREDLSLGDRVRAVKELYDELGNMQAVADLLKKSKSWVSKHVSASLEGMGYWARQVMAEGVSEDLEIIGLVSQLEGLAPAGTNTMWSVVEKLKAGTMGRDELRDKVRSLKEKTKEEQEAARRWDVESKAREDAAAARGVVAPGYRTTAPAEVEKVDQVEPREAGQEALVFDQMKGRPEPERIVAEPASTFEHSICKAWKKWTGEARRIYFLGCLELGSANEFLLEEEEEKLQLIVDMCRWVYLADEASL